MWGAWKTGVIAGEGAHQMGEWSHKDTNLLRHGIGMQRLRLSTTDGQGKVSQRVEAAGAVCAGQEIMICL